jgi:hypothetical protein
VFCNEELLDEIPCRITGINQDGDSIVASEVGDFDEFRDIYYDPNASANILSFSQTDKYCDNDYDKKRKVFTSTPPGGQLMSLSRKTVCMCISLSKGKLT